MLHLTVFSYFKVIPIIFHAIQKHNGEQPKCLSWWKS